MLNYIVGQCRKAARKQLEGIGVIELILILVIIIGLVFIFRGKIEGIMKTAFDSISTKSGTINKDLDITGCCLPVF